MTVRAVWLVVHLGLGASLLHGFASGLLGLWRRQWRLLRTGSWLMATLAWLTALTGTFVLLPWYRAKPPAGATGAALLAYPKAWLLAHPHLAYWHTFGMEWKEHIGWLAPILATAVAYVATCCPDQVAQHPPLRRALGVLLVSAFAAAAIAGTFGVLLGNVAPNEFLRV